jgi:hypothetical protein
MRIEDHPDYEQRLSEKLVRSTFETERAVENVTSDEVLELLDVPQALELIGGRPPKPDDVIQLEQLRGLELIETVRRIEQRLDHLGSG